MINKHIYILFLFGLILNVDVSAQYLNPNQSSEELKQYLKDKFYLQTFQIGQFIDRFNFDEKIEYKNNPPSRKFNLSMLVNVADTSLTKNPNLLDFLTKIGQDTINHKLTFSDTNWYAKINTTFNYHNKPTEIKLFLKLSGNKQHGYSWRITNVESSIFKNSPTQPSNYINPMNNEIGFTELTKVFINRKNIQEYYNKDYQYDPLSSFSDYIKNGDLVFNQIDSTQYVFEHIAGYTMTVDYFMRMNTNAGWLIAQLKKEN